MSEERDEKSGGQRIAEGLLDGQDGVANAAVDHFLKDAPRRTRFVLKRVNGAPGLIYDIATFAGSKDKLRSGLGIAGGLAGGLVGDLAGPVGGIAGSMAGEAGAEWLYDKYHDDLRRKATATAQWIKDRNAQAAHGFDRGMPPFGSPLR